jgi:hypothetical protein
MKKLIFIALMGIALWCGRAFVPGGSYLTRLQLLSGTSSRGDYALNCAGFIADAHGSSYLNEKEFYDGGNGQLAIVQTLPSRYAIDETKLQAGDVAAFRGSNGGRQGGVHVAVFLRQGVWIDSDARRGFIGTYSLESKSMEDDWFSGPVRILRWNDTPHQGLLNDAETIRRSRRPAGVIDESSKPFQWSRQFAAALLDQSLNIGGTVPGA